MTISRHFVFVFCTAVALSLIPTCSSINAFAGPALKSNQDRVIFLSTRDAMFNITCETPGAIDIPIAWYFNNIPLGFNEEDGRQATERGELIFSNIQPRLAGWYTCVASDVNRRTELDFLVVIGSPPSIERAHRGDLSYLVLPDSRVELPCLGSGVPPPTVRWFDIDDHEVFDGSENGRYKIDKKTGSLVITGFTSSDASKSPFYCEVENVFGSNTQGRNQRANVMMSAENITLSSPLHYINTTSLYISDSPSQTLECTTGVGMSYNVSWTRNFVQIGNENSITVNASNPDEEGYYCCQLDQMMEIISTYCITVVFPVSPDIVTMPPLQTTLPSNRNRTANLLCRAITSNNIDSPVVTLNYINGTRLVTSAAQSVVVSNFSEHYTYVQLQNNVEISEVQFLCNASNSLEHKVTESMTVNFVELCQRENMLKGSNAEVSSEDLERYWIRSSNTNASFDTVNNERVFVLNYTEPNVAIYQNVPFPVQNAKYYVELSGRLRQEGSGVASILLMVDNTIHTSLPITYPDNASWQWVYKKVKVVNSSSVTLALTVLDGNGGTIDGVAFFDDLCMTFENIEIIDTSGLTTTHFIIIGAVSGFVVLLLFLILCICICYCCCCRRKTKAQMMRKMSTNFKKKFSHSLHRRAENITMELSAKMTPLEDVDKITTEPAYQILSPNRSTTREEEYAVPMQSPTNNGNLPQPRIRVESEVLKQTGRPSVTSPQDEYQPIDIQSKDEDTYYSTCTPRSQSLEDLHTNGVVVGSEQSNQQRTPRTSVTNVMGYTTVEGEDEEEDAYYVTPHSLSCSVSSLHEDTGEYQNVENPIKYLQLVADSTTMSSSLPNSSGSNFLSTSLKSRPLQSTRQSSNPTLPPSRKISAPPLGTHCMNTSSLPKKERSISVVSPVRPPISEKIYVNDDDLNIYENSYDEENIYDN